jgi:hypothetical protein
MILCLISLDITANMNLLFFNISPSFLGFLSSKKIKNKPQSTTFKQAKIPSVYLF